MLESKKFERGKEIKTYYARIEISEMYQRLITANIVLILLGIFLLIVLNKIIPKTFITMLIIAFIPLVYSIFISYHNMGIVQKNRITIYENCIVGTSAFKFGAVRSFEAYYDDIADVQVNTFQNNLECVVISIRNTASSGLDNYPCYVSDCHSVANLIKSKMKC